MSNPKNSDNRMACPSCDQLYEIAGLEHRDKARCGTCNHLLTTYRENAFVHVVAFSMTGLVFFVLSCCYTFMSFSSSGLESVMTLPQAIAQIRSEGMWDLALLVAGFILIIPAVVLVLACALGTSLVAGWHNHWAKVFAKLIFHLQTWSMVEVFCIGVIVSLFKIAHMATVTVGPAFWTYGGFAIFFTLTLSNLDPFHTWQRLEELEP